jgi:hypothetical protein
MFLGEGRQGITAGSASEPLADGQNRGIQADRMTGIRKSKRSLLRAQNCSAATSANRPKAAIAPKLG